MMKTDYYFAVTSSRMEPNDQAIPLPPAKENALLAILPEDGDYTYLAIRGDTHYECIKVENRDGSMVVTRGIEGTNSVTHHTGSCVGSVAPATIAAIKDLICNYSCCEDGCPCDPVQAAGQALAPARVGERWEGSVSFAGSLPMTVGVSDLPSWMSAEAKHNTVRLSGTPPVVGTYNFSAAATNCGGTSIATQSCTLIVRD